MGYDVEHTMRLTVKGKPKPRARRIVSSTDTAKLRHRGTFTDCPYCSHRMEMEGWEKLADTLVIEEVHGKHGSVVVVAECPSCFKRSWVHQPFQFFEKWHDAYPPEWKAAAMAEHSRRHMHAVHEFADSLCAKCIHLRSLEIDTLEIIECTMGNELSTPPPRLHHHFGETECAEFKARAEKAK